MKKIIIGTVMLLTTTMSYAGVSGTCGVTYLSPGWNPPVTHQRSVISAVEGVNIINIGLKQRVSIDLFNSYPSSISIWKMGPCSDFHCEDVKGESMEFEGNLTGLKFRMTDFYGRALVVECALAK